MKAESNPSPVFEASNADHEGKAFSNPREAIQIALAALEPDGSVIDIDNETNEPFIIESYPPEPLDECSQDVWCWRLIEVAQAISELSGYIACGTHSNATPTDIEQMESMIKITAHYLSAYRHAPEFLDKAVSLLLPDEKGKYQPLQLPGGSWVYAPENITYRTHQLTSEHPPQ